MSQEDQQQNSKNQTHQVEIDGELFYYMPIDVAIGYSSKIQSGFFVPISEKKRVRIEFGETDMRGKLENYREKGLKNILLAEEDYYSFLRAIKKGLIGFFFKDDDEGKVRNLTFEQHIALVNKAMKYIGLSDEFVREGEDINRKIRKWISNLQSFNNYVTAFQKNNQDEFLKNMLVSYIGIGMIDSLNWLPQLKEKVVQVCFFSDMTLSEKDILQTIIAEGDRSRWTKGYLNHPINAAKMLERKQSQVKREVVKAVEQHHELPDGSGFPNGVKEGTIEPLSSIVIVARAYIDKLIESDFAYDDRKKFVDDLLKTHFTSPKFSSPCKALYRLLGIEG